MSVSATVLTVRAHDARGAACHRYPVQATVAGTRPVTPALLGVG